MREFSCSLCDICLINDHKPLLGDGSLDANIMFVSRNPSAFEMKNNIPMISKDGMFFQEYLDLFNFSRDEVYITNAVKCKTPNRRYPSDIEIYNCRQYLMNEINHINPKIIVLVGNTAIKSYFGLAFTNLPVTAEQLNGTYMIHNGRVILFMIHPSHAMTTYNSRLALFVSFLQLTNLYRIINPAHITNINY